jgi:hypothetical protein
MPVRSEVRQAQRTIASLDAAHRQAAGRLDQALARRAEAIGEQDHLVSLAQGALDRAVADMANGVSAELAAQLFGLGLAEVRRVAKAYPPVGADRQADAAQRPRARQRSLPVSPQSQEERKNMRTTRPPVGIEGPPVAERSC